MRTGPMGADEAGHMLAVLHALSWEDWPDDKTERMVLAAIRVANEAALKGRKHKRDYARRKAAKATSGD